MDVPILSSRVEWECPNCKATDTTNRADIHTRMHTCPKLGMLTAPMVPKGTRCKVIAHEREDYTSPAEFYTKDESGRVIMSVETVRDDGTDLAVFAPCVWGKVSS